MTTTQGKWKMEYVARLFIEGGFQAIADAHNAEGSGGIVMQPSYPTVRLIDFSDCSDSCRSPQAS